MRDTLFIQRLAIALLITTCSGWSSSTLLAEEGSPRDALVFQVTAPQTKLKLIEKTSRVIQLKDRIVRVDGFDPEIIKITTLPQVANQIRVQAMLPGVTSLLLEDEFGEVFRIDLSVMGDVRQIESIIKLAFPDSSVQAVKIKDSILLLGWVNQQDQLTPIVEIAEQFHPKVLNYMKVGGVQQVMLKVKIMEVQRAKIRQLGFNFLHLDENGFVQSSPGTLAPLSPQNGSLAIPYGGPPSAVISPTVFSATSAIFGITGGDFIFQGFLEALKEERLLKILAEPNLVTVNGQPANFLSGGEFPILVPQSLGTLSVQYKEFGVRLEFVPNVLGNGRLRMDVAPEVSERDTANSVSLNGNNIPALTTRRVHTQVEMNFGETLIVAGLISQRQASSTKKTPFLGELPWIGAAFRRVNSDEAETELMIMVTPELVAPIPAGQIPAGPGSSTTSPTDAELYFLGQVEIPKVGELCEGCVPEGGDTAYGLETPLMPLPAAQYDAASGPAANSYDEQETPDFPVPTDSLEVPPAPAPEGEALITPAAPRVTTRPRGTYKMPSLDAGKRIRQISAEEEVIVPARPRVGRPGLIAPSGNTSGPLGRPAIPNP